MYEKYLNEFRSFCDRITCGPWDQDTVQSELTLDDEDIKVSVIVHCSLLQFY